MTIMQNLALRDTSEEKQMNTSIDWTYVSTTIPHD